MIHSSKHSSCAVSEQGHGRRHTEFSGVSSVASCWQIQQVGTSGSGSGAGGGDAGVVCSWACEADELAGAWGLFKTKSGLEDSGVDAAR